MHKNAWLGCLLVFISGCDSEDSVASGSNGGTSGPGGQRDDAGQTVDNPDPINDACPGNVGPYDGPYGLKGACCYRTSNKARVDETADARTLEFRLPYFMLINHLMTIDPALFGATTIDRFDNEEQNLLMRYVLPQQDGKLVKGKGKLNIGPGRYNCDGTYSFYGDTAAPTSGGSAARWAVTEVELDVNDPEATDQTLVTAPYKRSLANQNKGSYMPYLGGAPEYALDWEGVSQGFDILELPTGPENYDCVGTRESSKWVPGGKSVAFGRLDLNDRDTIDLLGITFCQLMAFGANTNAPSCQDTARCMPGGAGCDWKRLPDSLCPVTDEEKSSWGCHLGYGNNPDNAPLETRCSQEPPEGDIDPDKGTTEGQCCDPLGRDDSGLPACNAWAQINEFVAAAVEITDTTADALQRSCHSP
jgi:hypothetical protein